LVGPLRLDGVLELVYLVVEVVDECEVALGDLIDKAVRHHPGRVVRFDALFDEVDITGGMCAGRRLPDREERVVGEHDVDLLVVDGVLVALRDGDEEHAEDVVAVPLECRPWLVLVLWLCEELREGGLLELLRCLCPELVGARVEQVDPNCGHRGRIRRGPK